MCLFENKYMALLFRHIIFNTIATFHFCEKKKKIYNPDLKSCWSVIKYAFYSYRL